jgi:hypothetical protein
MMHTDIKDAPNYTAEQMSDACDMLVAAELTLAGIPALKVPDHWPGYEVIAQPPGKSGPQRISVKSGTLEQEAAYIGYCATDPFEWLALVILPRDSASQRRIFVIPRDIADEKAGRNKHTTKSAKERHWSTVEVAKVFADFESNFALRRGDELGHPTVKSFETWTSSERSAFIAELVEREHHELTQEHPEDVHTYDTFFEEFFAVQKDQGKTPEGIERINTRLAELHNLAREGKYDLSKLPMRDVVLDIVDDGRAYLAGTRHDRKRL